MDSGVGCCDCQTAKREDLVTVTLFFTDGHYPQKSASHARWAGNSVTVSVGCFKRRQRLRRQGGVGLRPTESKTLGRCPKPCSRLRGGGSRGRKAKPSPCPLPERWVAYAASRGFRGISSPAARPAVFHDPLTPLRLKNPSSGLCSASTGAFQRRVRVKGGGGGWRGPQPAGRGHGPPPESAAALDADRSATASRGREQGFQAAGRPLLPEPVGGETRGSPEPRRGVLAKPAGRGACETTAPRRGCLLGVGLWLLGGPKRAVVEDLRRKRPQTRMNAGSHLSEPDR